MVDPAACTADWPSFRRMMARGLRNKDFHDFQSFVKYFFASDYPGSEFYPELARLLYIISVLPVGSCSVERSFSHMKVIRQGSRQKCLCV